MTIKNYLKEQVVNKTVSIMPNVSNETLVKLTYLAEKLAKDPNHAEKIKGIRESFRRNGPSVELVRRLAKNLSVKSKEKLVSNLILNWNLLTYDKKKKFEKKHGFMPPAFFVLSPTMRCQLLCRGCYAGEYTKVDDLPAETIDRLFSEAKELGTYFITISGGEPFIREDLLDLFEKHNDMYFLVYTNGQLIDEKLADRIAELGNVAPGISVEGFEKETDERRGSGTFKGIVRAMDLLRERGVVFGFSATPTRYNSEMLASDEFIDFYIEKGCSFGWLFQYIPIGKRPDPELMATPEQRQMLREFVHNNIRKTKPIFVGDFWNDGPYVKGCMAGARMYFHINCRGDVEPCVFMHFSVDNIKDKSLEDAITSDFFRGIREDLKKVENWLAPCCIIDNPKILRENVKKFGAKATHEGGESIYEDEGICRHIDAYSGRMHELTGELFKEKYSALYLKEKAKERD